MAAHARRRRAAARSGCARRRRAARSQVRARVRVRALPDRAGGERARAAVGAEAAVLHALAGEDEHRAAAAPRALRRRATGSPSAITVTSTTSRPSCDADPGGLELERRARQQRGDEVDPPAPQRRRRRRRTAPRRRTPRLARRSTRRARSAAACRRAGRRARSDAAGCGRRRRARRRPCRRGRGPAPRERRARSRLAGGGRRRERVERRDHRMLAAASRARRPGDRAGGLAVAQHPSGGAPGRRAGAGLVGRALRLTRRRSPACSGVAGHHSRSASQRGLGPAGERHRDATGARANRRRSVIAAAPSDRETHVDGRKLAALAAQHGAAR